jgi:hypothetical protein
MQTPEARLCHWLQICTPCQAHVGANLRQCWLLLLQEHCCFVDVHGTVVTEADQIAAAISTAASSQPSSNGTLQLLEADHVYNPDKQDTPGQNPDCTGGMLHALSLSCQLLASVCFCILACTWHQLHLFFFPSRHL